MGSVTCCSCKTEFSFASGRANIAAGRFTANLSMLPHLADPVHYFRQFQYQDSCDAVQWVES